MPDLLFSQVRLRYLAKQRRLAMWLCLGRLTAHFTIAPEDAVSARCQFALITRGVVHEAYGARIGTLITVQEAGAMILATFLLCARRVT